MLAKPFNLVLVYIVTTFNLVVLTLPLAALILPFVTFKNNSLIIEDDIYQKIKLAFFILLFCVSFFMLIYLALDFLFGFSLRASLKGCTRYEKIKDYDFLTELFDQVKNKFGEKSVKLYIKNSDEINAFAVSSLGGKAIVLTRGLINHYLVECPDPKVFLYALRSVLGHEMSHLINKDFLPTFLIITNQRATNFVSKILRRIFGLIVGAIDMIPTIGRATARFISQAYLVFNFILTAFNRFVVYNIYELLRRFISRAIEYRCDRQSARAFGGQNMALALSMLGEGGYFTLFSTHPGTKSRMKKVAKIKISDSVIRVQFLDSLANYFSLMFLIVICLYFAKQAGVDLLVREYIREHELIHRKLSMLWQLISRFFR
jgi:Zn-dependent protease with chaperone function